MFVNTHNQNVLVTVQGMTDHIFSKNYMLCISTSEHNNCKHIKFKIFELFVKINDSDVINFQLTIQNACVHSKKNRRIFESSKLKIGAPLN